MFKFTSGSKQNLDEHLQNPKIKLSSRQSMNASSQNLQNLKTNQVKNTGSVINSYLNKNKKAINTLKLGKPIYQKSNSRRGDSSQAVSIGVSQNGNFNSKKYSTTQRESHSTVQNSNRTNLNNHISSGKGPTIISGPISQIANKQTIIVSEQEFSTISQCAEQSPYPKANTQQQSQKQLQAENNYQYLKIQQQRLMNEILNDQSQQKSYCNNKNIDKLHNSQIRTTQAANSLSPNFKNDNRNYDMKDNKNDKIQLNFIERQSEKDKTQKLNLHTNEVQNYNIQQPRVSPKSALQDKQQFLINESGISFKSQNDKINDIDISLLKHYKNFHQQQFNQSHKQEDFQSPTNKNLNNHAQMSSQQQEQKLTDYKVVHIADEYQKQEKNIPHKNNQRIIDERINNLANIVQNMNQKQMSIKDSFTAQKEYCLNQTQPISSNRKSEFNNILHSAQNFQKLEPGVSKAYACQQQNQSRVESNPQNFQNHKVIQIGSNFKDLNQFMTSSSSLNKITQNLQNEQKTYQSPLQSNIPAQTWDKPSSNLKSKKNGESTSQLNTCRIDFIQQNKKMCSKDSNQKMTFSNTQNMDKMLKLINQKDGSQPSLNTLNSRTTPQNKRIEKYHKQDLNKTHSFHKKPQTYQQKYQQTKTNSKSAISNNEVNENQYIEGIQNINNKEQRQLKSALQQKNHQILQKYGDNKQNTFVNMKINVGSKSQLESEQEIKDLTLNQQYLNNLIQNQQDESSVSDCQNSDINKDYENLRKILWGKRNLDEIKNSFPKTYINNEYNTTIPEHQFNLQQKQLKQIIIEDQKKNEQLNTQSQDKNNNFKDVKITKQTKLIAENIDSQASDELSLINVEEQSKSALILKQNGCHTLLSLGSNHGSYLQLGDRKTDDVQNILINSKQQSKQSNQITLSSGACHSSNLLNNSKIQCQKFVEIQDVDCVQQEYLNRDNNVVSFQITQDAESKKQISFKENEKSSQRVETLKKTPRKKEQQFSSKKKSSIKDENISFSKQYSPHKKVNLNDIISNKENALRVKSYVNDEPKKNKQIFCNQIQASAFQENPYQDIPLKDKKKESQLIKQQEQIIENALQDTLIIQNPNCNQVKQQEQNQNIEKQQQKPDRQAFAPCNQNAVQSNPAQTAQIKNQSPPVPQVLLNDTMIFSQKSNLEEYIIGKQIGQGAYAVVRIGLHKPTNNRVAMKIYKKYKLEEPNRRKSVKREIKLMEKMKHKNIIQLHEIIDTSKYVILIMEYVGGGSLHGYLKSKQTRRLEEWDAKRIFKQIVEGINYCHQRCITHRDIKLENLLLDELNEIKIIDFGFSTCVPNDKKIKIFCGTPSYMAPEIVLKTEYCGPPADIWALGVLLFTILSGQFPYRGATDEELYDKICRADYNIPKEVNEQLSPAAKDLLSKLFEIKAEKRLTAPQILQHQWLYNVGKQEQSKSKQVEEQIKETAIDQHQQNYEQYIQSKRSKSEKLDRKICAPQIKNNVQEYKEKNENKDSLDKFQILKNQNVVNPFKVTLGNENLEQGNPVQQQNKNTQQNLASQRASSHNAQNVNLAINNKIIQIISQKLNYPEPYVRDQVIKDLMKQQNQRIVSKSSINQLSFVGNLYLKLINEDEEEEEQDKFQKVGNQLTKNMEIISDQIKDLENNKKRNDQIDYLNFQTQRMNQTQNLLMKSAISQTSLGQSAYATNQILSQNYLSLLGTQNLAIQPSLVPSMKSLNSNEVCGGLITNQAENNNQSQYSQLIMNNTLTSPFQTQMPQLNMNVINFNNTQPLKNYFNNLADSNCLSPSQNSGFLQQIRGECAANEKSLNMNFNQTNIFVTNNNQVYQPNTPADRKSQQTANQKQEDKYAVNDNLSSQRVYNQRQEEQQPHQSQAVKIINESQQNPHLKYQHQQLQGQKRSLLINNYFGKSSEHQDLDSFKKQEIKQQYFDNFNQNKNRNQFDYINCMQQMQSSPDFKER